MFQVITYKDSNGNDEVADFITDLDKKSVTNKDARIRYKKVMEYIMQLQTYGTSIGEPIVKHISGTDLWELRPIRDRIFFGFYTDGIFVLLHHFFKKTQKTPRSEIETAQKRLNDFIERNTNNEPKN